MSELGASPGPIEVDQVAVLGKEVVLVQPLPMFGRALAHQPFEEEKASRTEDLAHLFETAAWRARVVQRVARVHEVEAGLGKGLRQPLSETDAGANRVGDAVPIKELPVN